MGGATGGTTAAIVNPAGPIRSAAGRFGAYGGRYVPETLMAALEELEAAYAEAQADPAFQAELDDLLHDYCRPAHAALLRQAAERDSWAARRSTSSAKTCCTPARTRSTTRSARGCWRGAWASSASSPRPARASTASPRPPSARCFGMECVVYMGEEDMRRQELNVYRMRLLGAEVRGVERGLGDAEGRDQRGHARLGHQRPHHATTSWAARWARILIRRWCATSIASSARKRKQQILEQEGRLPDCGRRLRRRRLERDWRVLRVHLDDTNVRLIGVEAGGRGTALGEHAARFRRSAAACPACCRARTPMCCRTMPGRSR